MEDDTLRLKQRPALTLAIVAITVAASAIVVSSPTALAQLERTPAGSQHKPLLSHRRLDNLPLTMVSAETFAQLREAFPRKREPT
jgi:hypothetical protein